MDLLALIGFPKARGYEFKAKFFRQGAYYIYFKRPGGRIWKQCKSYDSLFGSVEMILDLNSSISLITEWVENPAKFEEYQKDYSYKIERDNIAKAEANRDIIVKEDPNATKMKKALE